MNKLDKIVKDINAKGIPIVYNFDNIWDEDDLPNFNRAKIIEPSVPVNTTDINNYVIMYMHGDYVYDNKHEHYRHRYIFIIPVGYNIKIENIFDAKAYGIYTRYLMVYSSVNEGCKM